MNKFKNIILLIVLDLMFFYTSLNMQDNKYSLIVTSACIVIMVALTKKVVEILSDKFNTYYKESKTEINVIKEKSEENHRLVIEKINNLRLENETVINNLSNSNQVLSEKLSTLIEAEKNLMNELKEHNFNVSKMLLNHLIKLNKEISTYQDRNVENIKEIKDVLLEFSSNTSSNISNMNSTLNNTIDSCLNGIKEELTNNNSKLYSNIETSINKVNEATIELKNK